MKAITIKQPWASLMVEGICDVINTSQKIPKDLIGKRILIHAGLAKTKPAYVVLPIEQFMKSKKRFKKNLRYDPKAPSGSIVGSVLIVDCVVNSPSAWAENTYGVVSKILYDSNLHTKKDWIADRNGNYVLKADAIYNWILANPIKFTRPIEARGKKGLWESECEILICPKCGGYCLHDNHDAGIPNWGNPVHECEYCGYMILESEFEYLK